MLDGPNMTAVASEETCFNVNGGGDGFDVNGGDGFKNRFDNETYVNHLKENGLSDTEDVVSYRSTRSGEKGKIVISKCLCISITVSVLVLMVCIGLIAGLVGRVPACKQTEAGAVETDGTYTISHKGSTIDPSLPWGGIRLPAAIVPYAYNLTLKVDLDAQKFTGTVEIDVDVTEATPYVVLHAYQLTVDGDSVSVHCENKTVEIYEHKEYAIRQFYVLHLRRVLKKGARCSVRIGEFTGPLQKDLRGLYQSSYKDERGNDRLVVASQLQATDARKVFPCFDEPSLKATFTVTLIHKTGYTALSNMPGRRQVLPNNWIRKEFETTPRMPTYLLGFVVCDFEYREKILPRDSLTIRVWAQKQQQKQTEYPLELAAKTYPFFRDYFDIPEVVPKADHVAVPEFSGAAMENWGIVQYRESALLYDETRSSIYSKYYVTMVMSHEIAHTWFGNMVTMAWWDDLWLNEAFASILMYIATDHIFPDWGAFDLMLVEDVLPVFIRDSLLTSHPIYTPIKDPENIQQSFDEISYYKGMAVLRQLQSFLGDDVFRDALRKYVKTYKYKNTVQKQLWEIFTEAAGSKYDIEEVMGSWTLQMGFPMVMVKSLGGGNFLMEQSRFLLNPNDKSEPAESPYGYRWNIPFTYQASNNRRGTAWMHRTSAQISTDGASWLVGNINKTGFYVVNYEPHMWNALTHQLKEDHTVFSESTRAGLVNDAFLLARAGHLDYSTALNLTTYMNKEMTFVPWKAMSHAIDFFEDMLSTTELYGLYQNYLKTLVRGLYREIGHSPTGTVPLRFLKRLVLAYACRTGVPEAVSYAKTIFESWMKYDSRVEPDYALIIYSIGIREGGVAEWDFLWNKYLETNVASEREIMMEALSHSREPWLLNRYILRTFDTSLIRLQDSALVFKYLSKNPLGRNVALRFMKENWNHIIQFFGHDGFIVREIVFQVTSKLNSEYDLYELEALYKRHPPPGVAARDTLNGLALIRSNIEWLKKNRHLITEWLSAYLSN